MNSNFILKRPVLAIVISIVIVLLGAISIKSLPIEQYPNITPPMVSVSANYLGADAVTVDNSVATPVAQSVMGVEKMLYMQSTSANDGSMTLEMTFDIDSDPDMNAVFTQNRVSEATPLLPASVNAQGITTQKSMENYLMVLSLYSKNRYDAEFLTNYAYINIRNELLKIDGVGRVQIMGAGEYAMRVWVDPQKLSFLDLSINDISAAIESQAGVYPLGQLGAAPYASKTAFTYTLTSPPMINTADEYGNIVLRTLEDGSQVFLKDVAQIELGAQSYGVDALFNGYPAATIMIYQAPGSNAVAVGNAIDETMQRLSESFIGDIQYEPVVDATYVIEEGIKEILLSLIFVLVLVILIIYIFLQNIRATLIPLIAIPVSLIGTFIFFPMLGMSINVFTLLGLVLAVGVVVDDAIVVVEAAQNNIDSGMPPEEATAEAMKKVTPAIVATTIVLAAIFIPIALMSGISGRLFSQFAVTIALSFIISGFNALTLSPVLCSLLLRKEAHKKRWFFREFDKGFDKTKKGYLSFASVMARHSKRTLIFVGASVIVLFFGFKLIPAGFLPEEDQGYVLTSVNLPAAASLERTAAVNEKIEEIVSQFDYVESVMTVAGFNMLSGIMSSNSGVIFIKLKNWNQRKESASEVVDILNRELYFALNDGEAYSFGPPTIPGLGTAAGYNIMILDKGGNSVEYLAENSDRFIEAALKKPAIASAQSQFSTSVPQRELRIDKDAVLKAGVDMSALHEMLATYLGGNYVSNFNRFGQFYRTYVQADAHFRENKDDFFNYYIQNDKGESIPLSSLVQIKDVEGVEYIARFNLFPAISVTGASAKGYSSAQTMQALEETAKEVLPDDMGYAWSGMSYQEANDTSDNGLIYVLIIVFVYLVLAALYENWSLPLSILLGIPVALLGAIATIYVAHLFNPLYQDDLFFQLSLLIMIALSTKNAILIIEYAHDAFMKEGKDLTAAAFEAADLRYRPILMTALSFIIGTIPLILASGANAHSRNIIGLALGGGMIIATVVGIFIYPTLYVFIGKIGGFEKKRRRLQGNAVPQSSANA